MRTIRLLATSLLVALCTGFSSCKTGQKDGVPMAVKEKAINQFEYEYMDYPNKNVDDSWITEYIGASDEYCVMVRGINPQTGTGICIIYCYVKDGDKYKHKSSSKF